MKPLPDQFTKHGFVFNRVDRNGDIALYEKRMPQSNSVGYEVFVVQKAQTYEIAGHVIEAHEHVPKSEAWGDLGFTYCLKDQAKQKFDLLVANPPVQVVNTDGTKQRGRKKLNLEIVLPDQPFTMSDLTAKYPDVSIGYLNLRLKEMIVNTQVQLNGTQRSSSGRGKPQNVYVKVVKP